MADHVYPEDTGTGAAEGDWNDAANFAQLAAAVGRSDFVVNGMGFSNISSTSVDIGQGVAAVTDTNATAANTSETRDSVAYVVEADARTGVTLTDTAINYIYLDIDLTTGDAISYHVDTDDTPPTTAPYLKIGTVDTNDNSSTTLNRFAPVVDVKDSGTVVETAGVLDFDENVSVTGNDRTATVSVPNAGFTNVVNVSSDYVASAGEFVLGDASGGSINVTLPGPKDGAEVAVKKISDSGNSVTIQTPGSETIDASSGISLTTQYAVRHIVSGANKYFLA